MFKTGGLMAVVFKTGLTVHAVYEPQPIHMIIWIYFSWFMYGIDVNQIDFYLVAAACVLAVRLSRGLPSLHVPNNANAVVR